MNCRILKQRLIEIIQEANGNAGLWYEILLKIKGTNSNRKISVFFRMYQLNFDGNKDFVYKKYWNMYTNHFIKNSI